VAVVGAGPAGLACAHDLALLGYRVSVLEASPLAGGMLTLGIPEYRLPRALVQAEIGAILGLGVELRTGQKLGRDFHVDDLFADGFRAVFLGIGAHRSRSLALPGMDNDGVFSALDFLLNTHLGYRVALGRRVVVVGGGNVALDAARSAVRAGGRVEDLREEDLREALRQTREALRLVTEKAEEKPGEIQVAMDVARQALRAGVREVDVYCLESLDEMPASRTEIEEALAEGIRLHTRLGPHRILGEGGTVEGIELIRVKSVFDGQGRFNPVFVEGTETAVPADTVILAVGQAPDLSWIRPGDGLEVTARGTLGCDADTLATTRPGVFAGGDVAFGPRNVVHAVAEGRRAARSIAGYLDGIEIEEACGFRATILRSRRVDESFLAAPRSNPPAVPVARRIGVTEVEQPFAPEEARAQARRCLECHLSPVFEGDKCLACGGCVEVCPESCLRLVDVARLPRALDPLLANRYGVRPEPGRCAAILKDEGRCIRCGLCAERCPAGAVTMERVERIAV
jgi:NADPH-dependent glutamate synthase beta subunit-like oxidoreductase